MRIAVVAGSGSGALGAGETGEGSAAPEPQRHGPLAAHMHAATVSCSGEQWWRVQPQLSLSEVAVSFDLDTRGPTCAIVAGAEGEGPSVRFSGAGSAVLLDAPLREGTGTWALEVEYDAPGGVPAQLGVALPQQSDAGPQNLVVKNQFLNRANTPNQV